MSHGKSFAILAALLLVGTAAFAWTERTAEATEIVVYATPTCGCCSAWVEHLQENGFEVEVVHQDDLSAIRREHGLPPELMSCHMGIVEGFAIEGHVPASTVQRLVAERPAVLGIAAPGMPMGSPGMEHPDGITQQFEVYSWDASGATEIFETIN
ncbi:MAG: DUF411 domain-containing protein [Gemmatimonas sp.]|nr:DUF411 domain-containing protein [Gemmatimonas sp.]